MNFRRRPRERLELSITPMIDVVFLLLIFFMVTTTFNRETELKINLPEAEQSEARDQTTALELSIDAEGVYYVNRRQVINRQAATLRQALLEAAGDNRDIPLVIHADGKTPHQSVISALDVVGKLGFKRVAFATQQLLQ